MSATEKLIRDSVVTRHGASKLASALAPGNLVKLSVDVFCAQNDYPNKYQAKGTSYNLSLTVSCLYPTAHQKAAAASCTTFFCLCKSVKDHALFIPTAKKMAESGCKGTTNFETTKTF